MRLLNSLLLVMSLLFFAAGNVWCAAARSTIPWVLNGVVKRVEVRREKHLGKDDVYLVTLEDGRVLQVDRPVAQAIRSGVRVKKNAWSRTLQVDAREVALSWSADAYGMICAMLVIGVVAAVIGVWTGVMQSWLERQRERSNEAVSGSGGLG